MDNTNAPSTTHQTFIADYVAAAKRIRARLGNSEQFVSEARILREMNKAPRLVRICAWCEVTPPAQAHVIYTHGCCDTCRARIEREG